MRSPDTLDLIYDGRFAFCIRALSNFRALDVFGALCLHDAHDPETLEKRFSLLRGADVDEAMYAVTEDGRIHRGFFAFRRLVWSSSLTWPLVPLFYFSGSGFFGPRVYAWVVGNRANFGCWSEACTLSTRPLAERAQEEDRPVSL